jgi:hypothetical protein
VLAGTFFVMAAMPLTALTEIGFAIAVGVLFDALVVRTTLVPALGFMLGEKMWWPAKLAPPLPEPAEGPPAQIEIPDVQKREVPRLPPDDEHADAEDGPAWRTARGSSRYG